jgi:general secretion pathway protein H
MRCRRQAGYSLLELLVVMTIVTIIVCTGAAGWHTQPTLRVTADRIAADLRAGRDLARAKGHFQEITVNVGERTWRGADGALKQLPDGIAVTTFAAAELSKTPSSGTFRFLPDGSSSGGTISLSKSDDHIDIEIDWISSQIQVRDE